MGTSGNWGGGNEIKIIPQYIVCWVGDSPKLYKGFEATLLPSLLQDFEVRLLALFITKESKRERAFRKKNPFGSVPPVYGKH